MNAQTFKGAGWRMVTELGADAGGDVTEIWRHGDGSLMTVCDGQIVAGPVSPRAVVLHARAVAQGASAGLSEINEMALLVLASDALGGAL